MTSLFGNYAIKQSLGAGAIPGRLSFDALSTSSASRQAKSEDATALAGEDGSTRSGRPSVDEQLFDARATAKVLASRVAMYMKDEWRRKLYRQLDSLLDAEEWLEGDTPLAGDSFSTFLRLMLMLRPKRRPGFALSEPGNLLAMWADRDARLSVECRANDQVRFIASHSIRDDREIGAIDTTLDRVPELARAFGLDRLYAVGPT